MTTWLVMDQAHEKLARKCPLLPQSQVLLDAISAEGQRVPDLDEPADDQGVRLFRAASLAGAGVFFTGDQRLALSDLE